MYLPPHLCRHDSLTPAERDYLDKLDLPTPFSCKLYSAIATAVIMRRVDGYHLDGAAPDWQTAARDIYEATATLGEGFDPTTKTQGFNYLTYQIAAYRPDKVLALLMRVEAVKKEWRVQTAASMVSRASDLPARTADRAGQLQHEADAARVTKETGLTDTERYAA
ncbi:hypothetical protein DNI29_04290 [Hymenobacter sediminis]|uniref:hypothetical protein n=1 Tax=Hymenobacter sediminis TaxID=2218621 RepID=UPI000DA69B62|nr:hypothetical protein [Hymenobacter sediminis]RPD50022.1 hypothetical protein DNI29_04290 [Hymenobacter sediminis]